MGRFVVAACAVLALGVVVRSAHHTLPAPRGSVTVVVDARRPAARVDARFLSYALDVAHVVGAPFWTDPASVRRIDLRDPRLRARAAALGPSFLRVGGTDADRTIYQLGSTHEVPTARASFVMTAERWGELAGFARAVDARVMFTLNAGPAARTADGAWDGTNARALVAHATARRDPVDVWELGNELNAFPLMHRLWISPEQYARDLASARALLDDVAPASRLAGPATAYWPVIGDLRGFLPTALGASGAAVDVVTWHYYPTQSSRCPVATRRARRDGPLRPDELDELATWAGAVEQARTTSAPAAELWLGETGGAQCGGEPGASDTWADALWWLDELGQLARRGETVVIRQTLVGGDYGLLSADDFTPRPSYWASWLWKQTMGATALAVDVSPRTPAVRAYAQCARTPGAVTVLLENLHATATATVRLAGLSGRRAAVHVLRAADAGAREVTLDGHPLGQHPPALAPTTQSASAPFEVPPLGVVFAMVEATSAVCP